MDDRIRLNRELWDERVPLHVASKFYDVAAFKAGKSTLQSFEERELGDVTGKRLLHLQCHFGLDTLSWARRGASVAGLDFSRPAVDAARRLAAEIGVPAEFVCADVYAAVSALEQRRFDVVYTGLGALIWLPDLPRWADVVTALIEPGGTLYLVEFHPITEIFAEQSLDVVRDYFYDPAGTVWDEPGSYVDRDAPTVHNRSVEWRHTLSDVVTALAARGLVIELLSEHDYTLFQRWPFLEQHPDGCYRLPSHLPRLPLMYSLRARRA